MRQNLSQLEILNAIDNPSYITLQVSCIPTNCRCVLVGEILTITSKTTVHCALRDERTDHPSENHVHLQVYRGRSRRPEARVYDRVHGLIANGGRCCAPGWREDGVEPRTINS